MYATVSCASADIAVQHLEISRKLVSQCHTREIFLYFCPLRDRWLPAGTDYSTVNEARHCWQMLM
jgi:hypothetical protein